MDLPYTWCSINCFSGYILSCLFHSTLSIATANLTQTPLNRAARLMFSHSQNFLQRKNTTGLKGCKSVASYRVITCETHLLTLAVTPTQCLHVERIDPGLTEGWPIWKTRKEVQQVSLIEFMWSPYEYRKKKIWMRKKVFWHLTAE